MNLKKNTFKTGQKSSKLSQRSSWAFGHKLIPSVFCVLSSSKNSTDEEVHHDELILLVNILSKLGLLFW